MEAKRYCQRVEKRFVLALFFAFVLYASVVESQPRSPRPIYELPNYAPRRLDYTWKSKWMREVEVVSEAKRASPSYSFSPRKSVPALLQSNVTAARKSYKDTYGTLSLVIDPSISSTALRECSGGGSWMTVVEDMVPRSVCQEKRDWDPTSLSLSVSSYASDDYICSAPAYIPLYPQCQYGYHCDVSQGRCVSSLNVKRTVLISPPNDTDSDAPVLEEKSSAMIFLNRVNAWWNGDEGKEENPIVSLFSLADLSFPPKSRGSHAHFKETSIPHNDRLSSSSSQSSQSSKSQSSQESLIVETQLPEGSTNNVASQEAYNAAMTNMRQCPPKSGLVWSAEKKRCVQCLFSAIPLPFGLGSLPHPGYLSDGYICDSTGNKVGPLGLAASEDPLFNLLLGLGVAIVIPQVAFVVLFIYSIYHKGRNVDIVVDRLSQLFFPSSSSSSTSSFTSSSSSSNTPLIKDDKTDADVYKTDADVDKTDAITDISADNTISAYAEYILKEDKDDSKAEEEGSCEADSNCELTGQHPVLLDDDLGSESSESSESSSSTLPP